MEAIFSYESESGEENEHSDTDNNAAADILAHLKPIDSTNSVSKTIALNSTPVAIPTVGFEFINLVMSEV